MPGIAAEKQDQDKSDKYYSEDDVEDQKWYLDARHDGFRMSTVPISFDIYYDGSILCCFVHKTHRTFILI